MPPRSILICTVGTSLLRPNLRGLADSLAAGTCSPDRLRLAEATRQEDWPRVAEELGQLPPADRTCGAEINSVASMVEHGYVVRDCGVFLLHSATSDGRSIATVLKRYFTERGHAPVEAVEIADLQDQDPRRFRTRGLRNLARELSAVIRARSPDACAINATGGYKAQVAIAVLLGQAIGVPVYYKHELFSEIIAFPPLPIALDFEVWMNASGMLQALAEASDALPAELFADEWDDRYESLVDRIPIDQTEYLELSPTGQIFHDTFRERFRSARDQVLPPPALKKQDPSLHDHGVINQLRSELTRYLAQVTQELPFVTGCATHYCHPQLNEPTRFRTTRGGVEGIYSDGTRTVKFNVHTTAQTPGQTAACAAALNEWLAIRSKS